MASLSISLSNVRLLTASVDAIVADPNAPAPPAAAFTASSATIDQSIADLAASNNPAIPSKPLTGANNFHFFDGPVGTGVDGPGDAFKGTTPGITSQFLDLTPDNIGITALTPNMLMASFNGNDVLTAAGGRNILAGGSGTDTYVGGTGIGSVDTFLADLTNGKTDATIINFHSGDDVALLGGLNFTDFQLSFADSVSGLVLTASPVAAGHNGATLTLNGYTVADIGSKLSVGFDNAGYVFVHAT